MDRKASRRIKTGAGRALFCVLILLLASVTQPVVALAMHAGMDGNGLRFAPGGSQNVIYICTGTGIEALTPGADFAIDPVQHDPFSDHGDHHAPRACCAFCLSHHGMMPVADAPVIGPVYDLYLISHRPVAKDRIVRLAPQTRYSRAPPASI